MSEIKSRADLFEHAARMMRMCDEAGVGYAMKIEGVVWNWVQWGAPLFSDDPYSYEFPLAIVEGKPVFKGDELYFPDGRKFTVTDLWGVHSDWHKTSWLPPKPRTVMVKLLREDAEIYAGGIVPFSSYKRISSACRKALENGK